MAFQVLFGIISSQRRDPNSSDPNSTKNNKNLIFGKNGENSQKENWKVVIQYPRMKRQHWRGCLKFLLGQGAQQKTPTTRYSQIHPDTTQIPANKIKYNHVQPDKTKYNQIRSDTTKKNQTQPDTTRQNQVPTNAF
jgi:hypothetical protein